MTAEVIESPLTREELGAKYSQLCEDPYFANLPGKIEIDRWGRILMSPPHVRHSHIQARLCRLLSYPGGEWMVEVPVATADGLFVVDVAWMSSEFLRAQGDPAAYTAAPQLCVEVASPSNSRVELSGKVAAYLAAGATEVWIVYPQSRRIERFGANGPVTSSRFPIDVAGLFD